MFILIALLMSPFIILFYQRMLSPLFIRVFLGSYHIKYLLFELRKSKDDITYYTKEELYSQLTSLNIAINHKLFKQTNKPQLFQGIEYGVSTKNLTSILGQPMDYEIISIANQLVVCLKYPVQANNIMDTYNYYFLNDNYYLAEYSFNRIQLDTKCKIQENINQTYQCDFKNADSFVVKNANGNHLYYNDFGFKICISYFNKNNPDILKLLDVQHQFKRRVRSAYEYNIIMSELSF